MKETVLVTGGAGFIGSHIARRLLREGYSVVVLDDLSSGTLANLPENEPGLTFVDGSVTDEGLITGLFKNFAIDYIFHEAAIASVQATVDDPVGSHAVNFVSTLKLLDAARQAGRLKRFLFASSAAVYGDEPELPKNEDSRVRPFSPYAIDKYASERFVSIYHSLYGLPTASLRYFNVYGPRQNPKSPYSGVLSIFMDKFANSDKPALQIYGDGKQTRDFIYIDDVVEANLLAMRDARAAGGTFAAATGTSVSLLEVIGILEKLFDKKADVKFAEARKGDIRFSSASIDRLRSLGFAPKFDLFSGLKDYIGYGNE